MEQTHFSQSVSNEVVRSTQLSCSLSLLSRPNEILSCYSNLIMLFDQDIMFSERHIKLFGRDNKLL